MLNLAHCHCDVTNGYKKKKNVFTLKTKDGSEFLFHAKDEEDLKTWVSSIGSSIAEHEEMAKWGLPQATTSSTDEGTRHDGSKAGSERGGERSDRAEKAEKVEKEKEKDRERDKDRAERSDRGRKVEAKRSEKSSKKK